jgi:hypothetical protein
MPIEKDVLERQHWFCVKWYGFLPVPGICSGIRTAHKWCYNFAWVEQTAYGVFIHNEGCENGKLFSWNEFGLGAGNLGTYVPVGEICFDSPRSGGGICDASNTGLLGSPLSVGKPFVSNLDSSVHDLKQNVVETGTFEFTAESGGLCQQGLWSWKRVLHEQVITASVAIRHVTVQWYIGGIPIVNNSDTISISAFCRWPFPLPKGRSENRVVQVKYEVITNETQSTIKIFNNPVDGSYSLSIGMSALVDIREYASYYTSWRFSGETCDFDPEQLREKEKCLRRLSDLNKDKAKSRHPKLGEPVVILSEEIWRFIREERREDVNSLLEIITNTFQDDPDTFTRAINQLEQDIGLAGVSRLITIGSAVKEQKVVLQR